MSPRHLAFALAVLPAFPAGAALPATQVTHGYSDDAAFSPDGRHMVTILMREGHEQLAIATIDDRDLRQITRDPIDHEDPEWSPDGRHIAYSAFAKDSTTIHVMDADGTHDRMVSPAGLHAIYPSWSADGRTLLYCEDDDLDPPHKNEARIHAIDTASGRDRILIAGGVNTYPKYSPDMRWIAFRKMVGESDSEVWLAKADGSDLRNLTNNPAFDGWPDWSPDGTRIAFASNRIDNYRIYVIDRDGSHVTLVADTPGRGTAPKWTRDGKAIFWTICQRTNGVADCEVWRAPAPARAG